MEVDVMEYKSAMLDMYKSGFLDGFRENRHQLKGVSENKLWNRVKLKCMKTFAVRYGAKLEDKLEGELAKVREKHTDK